jgi:hypothetical protein
MILILKTTIALSLTRKPLIIPRQITTAAILCKEKKSENKKEITKNSKENLAPIPKQQILK